jgi:hypothetical protein
MRLWIPGLVVGALFLLALYFTRQEEHADLNGQIKAYKSKLESSEALANTQQAKLDAYYEKCGAMSQVWVLETKDDSGDLTWDLRNEELPPEEWCERYITDLITRPTAYAKCVNIRMGINDEEKRP